MDFVQQYSTITVLLAETILMIVSSALSINICSRCQCIRWTAICDRAELVVGKGLVVTGRIRHVIILNSPCPRRSIVVLLMPRLLSTVVPNRLIAFESSVLKFSYN